MLRISEDRKCQSLRLQGPFNLKMAVTLILNATADANSALAEISRGPV